MWYPDMSSAEREVEREYQRKRFLSARLEATRKKLAGLENEARRYGMMELLTNPAHASQEWDRTIQRAQDAAASIGGSIGFGEGKR